jgi:predicted RNase H-like nuclease (RuvC/YqgF family)
MNKWQLLNALEEARTDNTKHTETISKLTTHVQGLWDEIEQKQFKINNLTEKNEELLDNYKSCMLRERKRRQEAAEVEKEFTESILNKSTNN